MTNSNSCQTGLVRGYLSALIQDGMPLVMLSNMRLRQCDKEIQMTRKKCIYLIIQNHVKHTEVNGLLELTFYQNWYIYQNVLTCLPKCKKILVNAKHLSRLVSHDVIRA